MKNEVFWLVLPSSMVVPEDSKAYSAFLFRSICPKRFNDDDDDDDDDNNSNPKIPPQVKER